MQDLLRNTGTTPKGCVLWLGDPGSRYGRKRLTFPGKPSQVFYVHRLMYMLYNKVQYIDPVAGECSHLCHEPRCVRIDHLILEPHATNSQRNHCHLEGKCTGLHTPNCIF